jgi:hypothetical protein
MMARRRTVLSMQHRVNRPQWWRTSWGCRCVDGEEVMVTMKLEMMTVMAAAVSAYSPSTARAFCEMAPDGGDSAAEPETPPRDD